jgi:tricorn protease
VRIWDTQERKTQAATEPNYDSSFPAWDPKGKYLYFLSARYINPFLDQFEARFIVNDATLPCVIALQADTRLPFAPRGDTDPAKPDDKKKDEKKDDAKKDDEKSKEKEKEEKVEPIKIDFDGLADRFVQVPVAPQTIPILPLLRTSCIGSRRPTAG